MTFPINLHLGGLTVNLHVVFELLAYTMGYRYYCFLRGRSTDKISSDHRIWLVIAAAAGALVGSRLVGYFSVPFEAGSVSAKMLHWLSHKSILGGLLGGTFGVELVKKWLRVRTSSGDLFVYPIILGMVLGRAGCFTQGVFDGTHGIESTLPWAMDLGDGIRRHPAQLYEMTFLGGLFFFIRSIEDRLADGARFKIFMIGYIIFRFLTELIKPISLYYFGLSAVQIACLIGIVYYALVILNPVKLLKDHDA